MVSITCHFVDVFCVRISSPSFPGLINILRNIWTCDKDSQVLEIKEVSENQNIDLDGYSDIFILKKP